MEVKVFSNPMEVKVSRAGHTEVECEGNR